MKKLLLIFYSLISAVTIFSQVPAYVPTNGLVGWWPFTGNANDLSGSGNNGAFVNGTVFSTDRFSNTNSAAQLDGVNDYINLPSGNTTLNIIGNLSVSFWIKTNDGSGLLASLGDNVNSANGGYLSGINAFNVGLGKIAVNTSSPIWYASSVTVNDNLWHHIVYTYDSGQLKLYIDNNLNGIFNSVPSPLNWIGNRVIGCRHDLVMTTQTNYVGFYDDMAVYNRALTSCEIEGLYNSQTTVLTVNAGIDQTICQSETIVLSGSGASSYSWNNGVTNNVAFTPPVGSTTYTVTGTNGAGCSAQDQITVNVNPNTPSSVNPISCETYTAPDGQVYNSSGNYSAIIPNSYGCDSIININLTVTNSTTSSSILTSCDTYTAPDGQIYNSSGTYIAIIPNAVGCDSTITINLTITNSNSGNDVITACDTYTWIDGNIYTSSNNSATFLLSNQDGCDSLVTLDLTLNNSTSSILNETAIDSYTLNSQTYNQSGTYIQTLPNTQGCDSTITLNLSLDFTGYFEIEHYGILVYPNPTQNELNVEGTQGQDVNFQIFNLNGAILLEGKLNNSKIDVSAMPIGLYIMELEMFNQVFRTRIIKQ